MKQRYAYPSAWLYRGSKLIRLSSIWNGHNTGQMRINTIANGRVRIDIFPLIQSGFPTNIHIEMRRSYMWIYVSSQFDEFQTTHRDRGSERAREVDSFLFGGLTICSGSGISAAEKLFAWKNGWDTRIL